ncbi:MAG TPA: nuclear transport factor 2 family protein [Pyrinomonadaceae bacterium]|jgi:hypothetical protein
MKARELIPRLLLCLCLAQIAAFARDSSKGRVAEDKTEAIEKEILRLEEVGRQKALKGDSEWDELIAEGAYMIAYDGSVILYHKGQSLPSLPLKSFKMSEMIVRVYGEAAVVTGLAEIESETAQHQPFSFKMRFLNVWRKSGDGWKIVVSERTGVKPPPK